MNGSTKEVKQVDLRSGSFLGSKTKKPYDSNDEELKVITLDNDLVVKLITNNKGVFVDFRKYYKGYPTKKGIRVYASKFREVANVLDKDIKKLIPENNDLTLDEI